MPIDNIACMKVSHYILIAYSYHESGCMECVRKRLEDKQVPLETYVPLMDIDHSIIDMLIAETAQCDGEYYYVYDVIAKTFTKLRMIQYPQCPNCGEPESIGFLLENSIIPTDDTILEGYRTKCFHTIADGLEKDIDSYLHPVFGLFDEHVRTISDSMPLISMFATLGRRTFDSHGRADTYKESFFTAILEGLERFHGTVPSTVSGIYASEDELTRQHKPFVSLNVFNHVPAAYYDEEALQVPEYSTDAPIFWRYVYNLRQKKYVLIPEERLYFSSDDFYDSPYDKRYVLDSSNGIALGSNHIEASIGGLFEVIERDAFLVHWYSMSEPLKVTDIERLRNPKINRVIALLRLNGYQTHIFDITLESEVPTYWVLLEQIEDDSRRIAFYTSAGTDVDPEKAIESALVEASTSIRAFLEYQKIHGAKTDVSTLKEDYREIKGLDDHIRLYSSPDMSFAFDFAIDSSRRIDACESVRQRSNLLGRYSGQKELFKALIEKLSEHHDLYQANLTSRTLQAIGFNCVKIIIPTMQNIGFGYLHQNVNKERIKQAVCLNKLNGETEVINHEPHPFP